MLTNAEISLSRQYILKRKFRYGHCHVFFSQYDVIGNSSYKLIFLRFGIKFSYALGWNIYIIYKAFLIVIIVYNTLHFFYLFFISSIINAIAPSMLAPKLYVAFGWKFSWCVKFGHIIKKMADKDAGKCLFNEYCYVYF